MFIQVWIFGKYFVTLTAFVTNDTISAFWKTCIHHHELDSFPIAIDFSKEMGGDIHEYDFLKYFTMKYVNIWKIYITQWSDIFQMTNAYSYKIMHG